ncbi:FHA domain-containing protein [Petralouisia muris]|uniref:FHA domain-containing protein n=1 Tax=Petralouisia muris TaxID=3032872 RepID=A0AC61S072_9FIRM|nr:FHA domain-containing serine/threonine-protein kinase [Petralouisia muris]TGY97784.1 FHA domain-containing protein [Petralouisia muris]
MKDEYRCPNCFQGDIGTGTCTRCGFSRKEEKQNPMRLPEWTFLANRYLIGQILGNGGFGITYKAFDVLNQCICAVKEFVPVGVVTRREDKFQITVTSKSNIEDFEHGKRQFMEEAEVLKKLTDVPEVVQIMDYFLLNNTAYFVMEYIEGATLKQLMKIYGGKIPLPDAMSMVCRAGLALDQVHKRAGIFHRDISPDNIMVTGDNRIKLIDFGNAKHIIGKRSQTLSVILKHGYAPPEQYSSTSSQGSYTDVYSLAVTFYYVVTGIMVPNAPDRFGGVEYRPLLEICPQVGLEASEAVDRALVLNSRNRTGSTAEFVRAISLPMGKSVSAYLKLSGENGKQEWNLPENKKVVIGRSGGWADIVPTNDSKVSKQHCELFWDSLEKQFYLIDCSTNGTFIGGARLEKGKPYIIPNGGQFSLGNHICDLEVGWKNG